MGGMPEIMAKGTILRRMDDYSKNKNHLIQVLDDLQNRPEPMDVLGVAYGILATPEEVSHMRDEWFRTWWPWAQPVEPIIRRGVIEAIKVALKNPANPLPLDFYWVCTPKYGEDTAGSSTPDQEPVEVGVAWSDKQVTVIFHTPNEPYQPSPPEDEPILVVKRDETTGEIKVVTPGSAA
jgi:hypothetical protein